MASTASASVPPFLLAGVSVVHPPHLEGDPTLATEILPGPPSVAAIRQQARKADPKKPSVPLSYLPTSDPGTTYTGLSGSMQPLILIDRGPRRKRARVDRSSSSLAQKPSNTISTSTSQEEGDILGQLSVLSPDVATMDVDNPSPQLADGGSVASRSPSSDTAHHTSNSNSLRNRGSDASPQEGARPVDKDKPLVRVKEEPTVIQLHDVQPTTTLSNEDHCSSCSSVGALVYCDGCPRAFHLWCLDPPMEASDLPEGERRWYCPSCKPPQKPTQKITPSIMTPLIQQLQTTLPVEFKLPEDIRSFFRDVATGPTGSYVDSSRAKPPRVGRHGMGEERDPYKLKDNKGTPVLCYHCGKSALPDNATAGISKSRPRGTMATQPSTNAWKSIVSCDFCPLHWHTDCLDPPLSCLPPLTKKWRCPNHASNVTPQRRIPKANNPWVDVTTCGQRNNGLIEVVNTESPTQQDRISVDEMHINGRRYRVPERVIVLDFWNKVNPKSATDSGVTQNNTSVIGSSSPLTSLSSLHDSDDSSVSQMEPHRGGDIKSVAEALCALQLTFQYTPGAPSPVRPHRNTGTQTMESLFAVHVKVEEPAMVPINSTIHQNRSSAKKAPMGGLRRKTAKSATSVPSRPKPANISSSSRVTRSSSARAPVAISQASVLQSSGSIANVIQHPTTHAVSTNLVDEPPVLVKSSLPRPPERTAPNASLNGARKPESSHSHPTSSGSPSKNPSLTIRIPPRKSLNSPASNAASISRLPSTLSLGENSVDARLRRSLRQQSSHSSTGTSPTPSSISSVESQSNKRDAPGK